MGLVGGRGGLCCWYLISLIMFFNHLQFGPWRSWSGGAIRWNRGIQKSLQKQCNLNEYESDGGVMGQFCWYFTCFIMFFNHFHLGPWRSWSHVPWTHVPWTHVPWTSEIPRNRVWGARLGSSRIPWTHVPGASKIPLNRLWGTRLVSIRIPWTHVPWTSDIPRNRVWGTRLGR